MFISVTRLRVRSFWFLPGFIYYALRSSRQAGGSSGNLGKGLLREANNTYWTCTAWQDEAAMRAFMMAVPHRSAMGKLAEWCDEASPDRYCFLLSSAGSVPVVGDASLEPTRKTSIEVGSD